MTIIIPSADLAAENTTRKLTAGVYTDGSGNQTPTWIKVGADGTVATSGGGGGGGGGGAITGPLGSQAAATSVGVAQATEDVARMTTLINKTPALGTGVMAGSAPVTLATDDTQIGAKTTGSTLSAGGSGIIGWLSDSVTQLKTLLTLLPGLGTKTMVGSQAVTLATDDTQIGAKTTAAVMPTGGSGFFGWLSAIYTQLVSGLNPAPMTEYVYNGSGVIAINTVLLGPYDCSTWAQVNLEIVSLGTTGVVTAQWSEENTFSGASITATLYDLSGIAGTTQNVASAGKVLTSAIRGRYFRLIMSTATTAGTTQIYLHALYIPQQTVPNSVIINQITPTTVASSLAKAKNGTSTTTDVGIQVLPVRRDLPTITGTTVGGYDELACGKFGEVWTRSYEKFARTYSASANITVAASATDIAVLPGSATTTVVITRVLISGLQTTAGLIDVLLIKRSAANTGGTSTALTAVPHDATDVAATAAPLLYTANPTGLGAAVGTLRRNSLFVGQSTSTNETLLDYEFGDKGKPITLAGVAQMLAINLNGVTVTGGVFNVTFEWFEY